MLLLKTNQAYKKYKKKKNRVYPIKNKKTNRKKLKKIKILVINQTDLMNLKKVKTEKVFIFRIVISFSNLIMKEDGILINANNNIYL